MQIPSVKGAAEPNAPFGRETRAALENAVALGEKYGLTGKHLDGYASHLEWIPDGVSTSAPIVGILGHVDVVPAGSGWSHGPFDAVVENNILYGRGAIDDKGPTLAALFGVIAAKEAGAPSLRRIRVILGADEESGFGCVRHYFAHEEMPETGFTPDAMFPLIYAEKGIVTVVLSRPAQEREEGVVLTALNGGNRSNMVPDSAVATLSGDPTELQVLGNMLTEHGISTEYSERVLTVRASGRSAHASTPDEGVNAIAVLAKRLGDANLPADQKSMLQTISRWACDTTGRELGIAWHDDISGPLTSNLGVAETDSRIRLTFNLRYPVTDSLERIQSGIENSARDSGFVIDAVVDAPPLYVPLDDPLVSTLLGVYREHTGDMRPPVSMGGGTYARAMRKGVAFGPALPSTPSGPHQADECWPLDDIIAATKIYALAIIRLANLPL